MDINILEALNELDKIYEDDSKQSAEPTFYLIYPSNNMIGAELTPIDIDRCTTIPSNIINQLKTGSIICYHWSSNDIAAFEINHNHSGQNDPPRHEHGIGVYFCLDKDYYRDSGEVSNPKYCYKCRVNFSTCGITPSTFEGRLDRFFAKKEIPTDIRLYWVNDLIYSIVVKDITNITILEKTTI